MSTAAITLPAVADARLPATYERAKTALAECQRIDECKDWADKAAALASYAKQADDPTLHHHALRIQSRAIRRAGELLQEFQTGPHGGRPKENGGDGSPVSQRQAAESAGLSKDQEKQAVRVANVPEADFEAAVESDAPPTVTRLADMGTDKRPAPPGARVATRVIGVLYELARDLPQNHPQTIADSVLPYEVPQIRTHAAVVQDWLTKFVDALPEGSC